MHDRYPVLLLESRQGRDSGDITPILLIGNQKTEIIQTHKSLLLGEGDSDEQCPHSLPSKKGPLF